MPRRRQAWDRVSWDRDARFEFSRDDGVGSTSTGATEFGTRLHPGGFGDEDEQLKVERLLRLERFLPTTPNHSVPTRRPHSGTGDFSPEVRSSTGDFSPDLAAHLPSTAGSYSGGQQSAKLVGLKLFVEDAELLSEGAVRPLCTNLL